MLTDRIALCAALAVWTAPAWAGYTHAPFHDRPYDVADTALRVLDGEAVTVPTDDVPLAAAVAALLLISEVGLAEAFEEAVGQNDDEDDNEDETAAEEDGYATAYAMLQTVRPWIAAVPADPEITDLMARLEALMPTADRPDKLDADPEAAEVVAQALVGQLERAANADLYLGRDLARAMETVSQLAAHGCAYDEATRPRWFEIASLYFEDALEAPLSVMAAHPSEEIEQGLEALHEGDLSACKPVSEAFADAKRRLFP